MEFTSEIAGREREIAALFGDVFAASEGAGEGALIGALARELVEETPAGDRFVFVALDRGQVVGAIVFSRIVYGGDDRTVFVLAPVAVATDRQGEHIGQRLIRHGLDALRAAGTEVALTYGDPAYYEKVGFRPITVGTAPAPFPLSQPQGWLGQSLTGRELGRLKGPASCVGALSDPAFW